MDGGTGADKMVGGTGDDIYYIDNVKDVIVEKEEQGIDRVVSTVSYRLGANLDWLTLDGTAAKGTGNELTNRIDGNAAANILSGLAGDDILAGHGGRDSLKGGAGADVFAFGPDDGVTTRANADVIGDFRHTEGDRIDLSAFDAVPGGADNAFQFIGSAAFHGVQGEVRVTGVSTSQYLALDINGDKVDDFVIKVVANTLLSEGDLIL